MYGTLDAAPGNNVISASIELFTSIAFLVYTSVMLASFLVNAYKNKTMNLMFSYPIKRQKILASQMNAVWLFNFAALILTKLVIYLCVFLGTKSHYFNRYLIWFCRSVNISCGNKRFDITKNHPERIEYKADEPVKYHSSSALLLRKRNT